MNDQVLHFFITFLPEDIRPELTKTMANMTVIGLAAKWVFSKHFRVIEGKLGDLADNVLKLSDSLKRVKDTHAQRLAQLEDEDQKKARRIQKIETKLDTLKIHKQS